MARITSKQPKIGYFIQSRGPGDRVEFEEVYVYGPTRRSDEGIVGHDLRMRPKRLGPGNYTFAGSPDDVEWTKPASEPTKKTHAQIKHEIDEILARPYSHGTKKGSSRDIDEVLAQKHRHRSHAEQKSLGALDGMLDGTRITLTNAESLVR